MERQDIMKDEWTGKAVSVPECTNLKQTAQSLERQLRKLKREWEDKK